MSVKRKMVASMVESGGYLDFGSWAGECITDPDLCVTGLTVTMWLRIQAKDVNFDSEYQYIISSGAEGESMRGIVFLLKVRSLVYKPFPLHGNKACLLVYSVLPKALARTDNSIA